MMNRIRTRATMFSAIATWLRTRATRFCARATRLRTRATRFCAILFIVLLENPSLRAGQPVSVFSATRDSAVFIGKYIPSLKNTVLPAAMFITGVAYRDNAHDRPVIKNIRAVESSPADYIQYSPAVLMLGIKACGVEGRSDWQRMTVTDAIAVAAMVAATGCLKYTVRRERPDGSSRTSFPSGHAARAFMTATMLHKEYGQTVSPWFSVAGYGAAAATGLMRVSENNHWVSDILAGAGIGIYSVELAYTLSDLLYGESRITKPLLRERAVNESHWRFSLSTDFYLSTLFVDDGYGHERVKPAYSAGIEASYMPWYLGAELYAGFTRLKWTGSGDIFPADGAPLPELKSICAGVAGRIPLGRRITIDGRLLAGKYLESLYAFTTESGRNVEFKLPDGRRIITGAGLSLRTSGSSELSIMAGTEMYELTWGAFTLGTKYNITY